MSNRFVTYVLRGLTVVLPIALTIWCVRYVLLLVDGWILPEDATWRPFPGLGMLAIFVVALAIGILAEHAPTRDWVIAGEHALTRVPGLRFLYSTIKDVLDALLGRKQRFNKPVLVTLGAGFDAEVLGFVTAENLARLGVADKVAVYFPQSYNWGGNILILPRDRLTPVDLDSASVMSFIFSGGVTRPPPVSPVASGLRIASRTRTA
jgi:uncharacterized membrane protein